MKKNGTAKLDPTGINVTVLMGGPSNEHDVSVLSGKAIETALWECGFKVAAIVFADACLPELPAYSDIVFPALHGEFGEDGTVQRELETRRIPFVGSGSEASRLIIDKAETKERLKRSGIAIVAGTRITNSGVPFPDSFQPPLILKPNHGGSTLGVEIVCDASQWAAKLSLVQEHDIDVIVEPYIRGVEATVGVLDGAALPIVEIIPPGNFFDYDAKYTYVKGKTVYNCPPRSIAPATQLLMKAVGEKVYQQLGARDMLRVDMIVDDKTNDFYVLEANSIPGFTANSLFPKAAQAAGITFNELCRKLVLNAYARGN